MDARTQNLGYLRGSIHLNLLIANLIIKIQVKYMQYINVIHFLSVSTRLRVYGESKSTYRGPTTGVLVIIKSAIMMLL